ncbi:hypothetical protein [Caenimonas soli]|uniref:hypothetical protein n=1 Tax=Caenimonas soli TaxID=2735555 RepID=UPI0015560BD5|nr:hypothetical protein [Caenimonas soli]NPC59190.1 hypothetical protein [Caenimonas soli]
MPSLKSLLGALFGASNRLSDLEKRILVYVRAQLAERLLPLWDKQIHAINKVQRLPEGVEVNFYRMRGGRPTFDAELAFPNKAEELQLAKLEMKLANVRQKLVARVWCVKGFLFSIEYEGSINYFEEAAGLDTPSELHIDCELTADLAAPH